MATPLMATPFKALKGNSTVRLNISCGECAVHSLPEILWLSWTLPVPKDIALMTAKDNAVFL